MRMWYLLLEVRKGEQLFKGIYAYMQQVNKKKENDRMNLRTSCIEQRMKDMKDKTRYEENIGIG